MIYNPNTVMGLLELNMFAYHTRFHELEIIPDVQDKIDSNPELNDAGNALIQQWASFSNALYDFAIQVKNF
jgi:hypothetical protein